MMEGNAIGIYCIWNSSTIHIQRLLSIDFVSALRLIRKIRFCRPFLLFLYSVLRLEASHHSLSHPIVSDVVSRLWKQWTP
jgi:hypothetical protein